MASLRGRIPRLALVLLVSSATGCVLVIGLRDDYVADAPAVAFDAGPDVDAEASVASVFSFLGEPTGSCVSCLAQKCGAQASECAAEASCASVIGCMAGCSPKDGPVCFDQCDLPATTSARDLYIECATSQCLDECRSGTELGCVGAYTWPVAKPDPGGAGLLKLGFRVRKNADQTPREGLEITPCPFNGTTYVCTEAAMKRTDASGTVTLDLLLQNGAGTNVPQAWRGYVRVIDKTQNDAPLLDTLFRHTRPFYQTRGDPLNAPLASAFELSLAPGADGGSTAGTGIVVGAINDCRALNTNQRARGLTVAIADAGVSPVYTGPNNLPQFGATASVGGGFYFKAVPVGRQQLIEVSLPDGGSYAKAFLDVESGGVTTIAIWPQPSLIDRQ